MSNSTTRQITGDFGGAFPDGISLPNATSLKGLPTDGSTFKFSVYDTDAFAYKDFATFTAGATPSAAFAAPSGGTLSWDGGAIGGTTPAAGAFTSLSTTGNATFAGNVLRSVGNALTAAGTTRTDALALTKDRNVLTTVGSGTGVVLPTGVVGMAIEIFNAGANAAQVYAPGSGTIDGTAGATGVVLTNDKRCVYYYVAANTWISAQLGAISA